MVVSIRGLRPLLDQQKEPLRPLLDQQKERLRRPPTGEARLRHSPLVE